MAAPEAGVELLATKRPFLDLEDQGPVVASSESGSFASTESSEEFDFERHLATLLAHEQTHAT